MIKQSISYTREKIIYGFESAGYQRYAEKNYEGGARCLSVGMGASQAKSKIYKSHDWDTANRTCKSLLVNTVADNVIKHMNKEPITPIYFIYQTDHWSPDVHRILKRSNEDNVTGSELRTAYKLIEEFPNELVREVAAESIVFKQNSDDNLVDIPLPWAEQDSDWQKMWSQPYLSNKLGFDEQCERTPLNTRPESELPKWAKKLAKLASGDEGAPGKSKRSDPEEDFSFAKSIFVW